MEVQVCRLPLDIEVKSLVAGNEATKWPGLEGAREAMQRWRLGCNYLSFVLISVYRMLISSDIYRLKQHSSLILVSHLWIFAVYKSHFWLMCVVMPLDIPARCTASVCTCADPKHWRGSFLHHSASSWRICARHDPWTLNCSAEAALSQIIVNSAW